MSVVISIENVSKLYRLGEIGTGSLSHDINRWWHTVRGKEDPYLKIGQSNDRTFKGESDYVYALRDVSFEVKQGEVLGIIGRNGAGKSTLLKILSRVTTPTSGEIKAKGRIASLLEVGTGFHPELSGRDNIYLNGAILGMRKAEITSKLDEIIAFSGCERYIDTPVKRYSSGMYVRLAFAVAAHLEPEILIVDEVLAVGDSEFQKKCLGKMKDVAGEGRTVLFVSHNMTAVSSLCSKAILLDCGEKRLQGSPSEAINGYLAGANTGSLHWNGPAGDETAQVLRASVKAVCESDLRTDKAIIIEVEIQVMRPICGLILAWEIWSKRDQLLAYSAADDALDPPADITQPGTYKAIMEIPPNSLSSGTFQACLDFGIHNRHRIVPEKIISLEFTLENSSGIGRRYPSAWADIFRPAWKWEMSRY